MMGQDDGTDPDTARGSGTGTARGQDNTRG